MKNHLIIFGILLTAVWLMSPALRVEAARAQIPSKTGSPYRGAIVVREDTGEILFEKNADTASYPASIVKLMMLLLIQEKIEDGSIKLQDKVLCTAEASRMGGSQVYLKENEIFPVEDLLYALIIQSANDAAVALALHVAGSKDGFVEMMQKKARELGMDETEFHSVHGLPPGKGQKPDLSTPRDMAILCRELLKHPDILRYTSTPVSGFRDDTFEMRSHNPLLETVEGCDGLKTGYFRAGGYSIAATASRDGRRLIAVVMGSKKKEDRNNAARELLAQAFSSLPASAPGEKPAFRVRKPKKSSAIKVEVSEPLPKEEPLSESTEPGTEEDNAGGGFGITILYILIFLVQAAFFFWIGRRSRKDSSSRFPPTILQK